ncbi:MAG: hypothetical protein HY291_09855 [Planctomycetes bacterium]|nr:hypothetical protein [Planctomycetota bacterium]
MLTKILIGLVVIYFLIGLAITAFCVHMSYHEAAIGFHDNDDAKAQGLLESRFGLIWLVVLFVFWPLALIIAFAGKRGAPQTHAETPSPSAPAPANAETAAAPAERGN